MNETFYFIALGQAIKKACEAREMTREQLTDILNIYAPTYTVH